MTTSSKIYNALIILESLILLVCSIIGLLKFQLSDTVGTMTIVVGVYCNVYLLYFSSVSLKNEDVLQMALSVFAHLLLTFVASFHCWYSTTLTLRVFFVMWVTCVVFQVIYFVLTPIVITSFGLRIFEKVGALVELQRMYKQALFYFTALRVDTFLSFFLLLQLSMYILERLTDLESIINFFSAAWSLGWGLMGYYVVEHEASGKTLAWVAFAVVGQPIYIVYKMVQIYHNTYYQDLYPSDAKVQFMVVAVLWIFVRIFVIIYTLVVVRNNYGKGLLVVWTRDSNFNLTQQFEDEQRKMQDQQRLQDIINSARNKHKMSDPNYESGSSTRSPPAANQSLLASKSPLNGTNYNTLNKSTDNNNGETLLTVTDYTNGEHINSAYPDDLEPSQSSLFYQSQQQSLTLTLSRPKH